MYDADNMPVLNLREWLGKQGFNVCRAVRDGAGWYWEPVTDDVTDRLQCEFENAELEHARQQSNIMIRKLNGCQHTHDRCQPRCMCICWVCTEERKGLYWCHAEQGIPDCPGHQHFWEHCPGVREYTPGGA